MTQAVSGMSAALFQDDPVAGSVIFTYMALVDSGDHITYQAPWGFRYWDNTTLLIEKQVHGAGGWIDITSSCTANRLRGSITSNTALNPDDLVRASGYRRAESNFDKVMGLYNGVIKIDGTEIDTSSVDDVGWGSSIVGKKKWSLTAGTFYYDGSIPISQISSRLIAKLYAFNRAGYHQSGNSPSIDISGGTDNKFKIQADLEASATEVTLTQAGKNTGALIAAEMQTKIRALGGAYAAVTVEYLGANIPGSHVSGASPSTDISGGTDNKFKIQADTEGSATEVTLTQAGKNNGYLIASEMQRVIRAIGGVYGAVQVQFQNGRYVITSGTAGPNSKIRITDGATNNVADDLKIGTANGGTNYDGSGGNYKITSGTNGPNSKIRITNGTTYNVADDLKIGTANGGTDVDGSAKSFVGIGSLGSLANLLANMNEAQKQDMTINGEGEIYPE